MKIPDITLHDAEKLVKLKKLQTAHTAPTKEKFGTFIQLCWPLIPMTNIPSDDVINSFQRQVWYCNCSGKVIPELQKFNANKQANLDYENQEILCSIFYNNGYKKYRVYSNGLAFLDVHILGMLFDYYINSNYSPQPELKDLIYILKHLDTDDPFSVVMKFKDDAILPKGYPRTTGVSDLTRQSAQSLSDLTRQSAQSLSDLKDQSIDPQYEIYQVKNMFCVGTIIQKNIIPKDMVKDITSAFQDDDVIDTGGYRGLYLLVKVNGKFQPVVLGEYYPIWPLEDLKRRGYRYWLKKCMWNSTCCFDEIKFDNGISWSRNSDFHETNCDGTIGSEAINGCDGTIKDTIINTLSGQITITKFGEILDMGGSTIFQSLNDLTQVQSLNGNCKTNARFCDIEYPFSSCDVPNALLRSIKYNPVVKSLKVVLKQQDIFFRMKISEYDYLIIGRDLHGRHHNGISPDIYISDLNDGDQCSIYCN